MIEIKKLTSTDSYAFQQLLQIFRQVFDLQPSESPSNDYLTELLSNPNFLVLVAQNGTTILGGLTIHILPNYYNEKPIAYIYDVAVHPDHQRQGIGKQLIRYLQSYCHKQGFHEAYVEAETDDQPAVHFYRSTAPDEELQATHFTYRWT